jgi:CubicO group peptidase (beta-lactamase class C family)
MSAAVARDGVIVWQRGFGQADISAHKPATADTVYHLASLTKPFAATVLLQLVQEGRLNLDSPVSDYGIDLKSQGTIRARHVLTHTSEGIPGETYRYNGTRFGELDKVLSGVTGRTFASEVSARILEPLALTNTSPNPLQPKSCEEARRDAADFRRRLAQGYRSEDLTPVEYKEHFVTAAGLVSTVGDMVRFSDALDDGLLLRPDTIAWPIRRRSPPAASHSPTLWAGSSSNTAAFSWSGTTAGGSAIPPSSSKSRSASSRSSSWPTPKA